MPLIKRPKGTYDIIGEDSLFWHHFENKAKESARVFGFEEIRTPILERTELFKRSVGDETDIVQKEMYTFEDKGKRSMTMRPEGTAPVVRAFLENNLMSLGLPQKVFYMGPMFRYEKPQTGRYRQFHQFGVEIIGSASTKADAEIIWQAKYLIESLHLHNYHFQINHLGCSQDRLSYKEALKEYYQKHYSALCEVCKERFDKNILRLLDCKNPKDEPLKLKAPKISEYLCDHCSKEYSEIKRQLEQLSITFEENPFLVRGLDYYTGMVFEVKYPYLGNVLDILGGGRYDHVIAELGGKDIPAVGYACGIERILSIMKEEEVEIKTKPLSEIFVLGMCKEAEPYLMKIVRFLRRKNISVEYDLMERSLKSQMKYASKIGAKYTIIIGNEEIDNGIYVVKDMETGNQTSVESSWIENYIIDKLEE
ncbi:MAG: histidine--tRNA ligase [bacterium]